MSAAERITPSPLRTGISVSAQDGRLRATVELHGDLCAMTAQALRTELDQLVDDGIGDITINLRHLRLCTSHGLDVFDHIHRVAEQRHGGSLRLDLTDAPTVVARVVRTIDEVDSTFSPRIVET